MSMNAMLIKNIFYCALTVTIALPAIISCANDGYIDPYDLNYVFIYSPGETDHNLTYLSDGTFREKINEQEILVPVRCTRPAPNDITVTFSIDKSLIDAYNSGNETSYVFLENARLEKSAFTIKKGEYVSFDSLQVVYTDMTEFQDGSRNYILPITISGIQGEGVELSESRTFFLTYESSLIQMEIASTPVGTVITDKSGWSYALNGAASNLNTYVDDGSVLDIDLGKEVNVNTISLSYYAWYYSPSGVKVSVSADGITYENLGEVYYNYSNIHHIRLFSPKQTRHIRITSMGYYYSSGYVPYITGVDIYTVE